MKTANSQPSWSRRNFLAGATAGFATLAGRPTLGARSPNERLGIGLIGVGSRASAHLAEILALGEEHGVQVTALCDVQRPILESSSRRVEQVQGQKPATTTRFEELLLRPDVDAVVISTPDFSHGTILTASLEAGKDVYIEKPMTIDLDSANRALDLALAGERVVQAGTQRRSDGHFRAAAQTIAGGELGTISRVSASIGFNHARWVRDVSGLPEADVDWDAYLLNLPARPFDPKLLLCWQLFRDTSNGMPGLWMTHYADAVHMMVGARYPTSAVALGGIYVWKDGREHTDTFHALLEYPEGFLFDWGMGLGNASGTHFTIHGTEATLDAERWTLARESSRESAEAIPPLPSTSHMANWLGCLRTRSRPNADILSGHQHAVATILAARAFETGRRQRYDAQRREILPA